jgi:hypothetical protein
MEYLAPYLLGIVVPGELLGVRGDLGAEVLCCLVSDFIASEGEVSIRAG